MILILTNRNRYSRSIISNVPEGLVPHEERNTMNMERRKEGRDKEIDGIQPLSLSDIAIHILLLYKV